MKYHRIAHHPDIGRASLQLLCYRACIFRWPIVRKRGVRQFIIRLELLDISKLLSALQLKLEPFVVIAPLVRIITTVSKDRKESAIWRISAHAEVSPLRKIGSQSKLVVEVLSDIYFKVGHGYDDIAAFLKQLRAM